MLIFQIYEFLALEGRWLKKQILPAHFQAVVFDLGAIYKFKDKELADSIARIGECFGLEKFGENVKSL